MGQALQDYHLSYGASDDANFNALASGGDLARVVIDNSADFANSILNWRKLTIERVFHPEDRTSWQSRLIACGLFKMDQDDLTAIPLDSQEAVEEERNKGRLIRGPWLMTSPVLVTSGYYPPFTHLLEPIVLKKFVLQREEDLVMCYTNLSAAFAASNQRIQHYTKGWVRKVA